MNDMWDGMQVMARHRLIMLVVCLYLYLYVVRLVNMCLNAQGSTFMSNVTRKSYTVVSPSCSMNCATECYLFDFM